MWLLMLMMMGLPITRMLATPSPLPSPTAITTGRLKLGIQPGEFPVGAACVNLILMLVPRQRHQSVSTPAVLPAHLQQPGPGLIPMDGAVVRLAPLELIAIGTTTGRRIRTGLLVRAGDRLRPAVRGGWGISVCVLSTRMELVGELTRRVRLVLRLMPPPPVPQLFPAPTKAVLVI